MNRFSPKQKRLHSDGYAASFEDNSRNLSPGQAAACFAFWGRKLGPVLPD
jgi:hypothetical protein